MTVYEIIKKHLEKNGFDGLCTVECGCEIEDLAPCGNEFPWECEPGYKIGCTCEHDCDWHITTTKPPTNNRG